MPLEDVRSFVSCSATSLTSTEIHFSGWPPTGIHDVMLRYKISVLMVLFWSFLSIPARHNRRMSGILARRIEGLLLKAGWINLVKAESAAGAWCARFTADMSSARVAKSIKAGAVCNRKEGRNGKVWKMAMNRIGSVDEECVVLLK